MAEISTKRIITDLEGISSEVPPSFSLHHFESLDSTNMEVKKAISEGEPEGYSVFASQQNGGYGRQGRTWTSPLGGMYLSCVLRPLIHGVSLSKVPTLSLVLSIAVRRCLRRFSSDENIKLKWPNDVVYTAGETLGKLVGISVEAVEDAVCAGIGINVFHPEEERPVEGKYTLTYLADLVEEWKTESTISTKRLTDKQIFSMEELIAVLISEVYSVYNQWLGEGFTPFREEFQTGASLFGRTVQVVSISHDVMHEGVVCDIDQDGLLCLRDKKGNIVCVHSGEVHLK